MIFWVSGRACEKAGFTDWCVCGLELGTVLLPVGNWTYARGCGSIHGAETRKARCTVMLQAVLSCDKVSHSLCNLGMFCWRVKIFWTFLSQEHKLILYIPYNFQDYKWCVNWGKIVLNFVQNITYPKWHHLYVNSNTTYLSYSMYREVHISDYFYISSDIVLLDLLHIEIHFVVL